MGMPARGWAERSMGGRSIVTNEYTVDDFADEECLCVRRQRRPSANTLRITWWPGRGRQRWKSPVNWTYPKRRRCGICPRGDRRSSPRHGSRRSWDAARDWRRSGCRCPTGAPCWSGGVRWACAPRRASTSACGARLWTFESGVIGWGRCSRCNNHRWYGGASQLSVDFFDKGGQSSLRILFTSGDHEPTGVLRGAGEALRAEFGGSRSREGE